MGPEPRTADTAHGRRGRATGVKSPGCLGKASQLAQSSWGRPGGLHCTRERSTGSAVSGHPSPSGTPWTVAQEVEMSSLCLVYLRSPSQEVAEPEFGHRPANTLQPGRAPPPMGGAVCAGTPGIVLECIAHPLPAFPGVGVVLSEVLGTVMDPRGPGLREFISAPSQRPPISPGSPGTSEPHVLIPRSWVTVLSAPQVTEGVSVG